MPLQGSSIRKKRKKIPLGSSLPRTYKTKKTKNKKKEEEIPATDAFDETRKLNFSLNSCTRTPLKRETLFKKILSDVLDKGQTPHNFGKNTRGKVTA